MLGRLGISKLSNEALHDAFFGEDEAKLERLKIRLYVTSVLRLEVPGTIATPSGRVLIWCKVQLS